MLVQSCYKAWWNSLYFIFLYKPKNRFVYFFFWVAGICAVRFRRLTYLLNDSIISLLARVSWYRAHLISSAIPLYCYLLVIPDTEIIYFAQQFRYITTCLCFLIQSTSDQLSYSAISLLACYSWYRDHLYFVQQFRYITACMCFLIHTHSSESRLSYSAISILFLLAFPYTQSRRAGHVTIFELRDNDNGIEYQGQEKIRKIVRPRCLNGVATPNIDIIQ